VTDALDTLVDRVFAAAQARTPLVIRAGGTKDFYGNTSAGDLLDPRAYAGIVSYEPTELVITARCGTPLAQVEAALAAQGQMLGFEPPHFAEGSASGATIGGMVAAGLSGPRRAATVGGGSVRDFVLGASLLTARGDVLRFGGQVMKNVAGYDVARLLTGSLGTLGLILEVSFKVVPRPLVEHTVRVEANESTAIKQVNTWAGKPWPISATFWHDGVLCVRLSGSAGGVHEARAAIGGDEVRDAALWTQVKEHRFPFFSGFNRDDALWRLSVPSTTPPLDLGPTLIEWGGALRWVRSDAPADTVRARARAAGGHATLFRGGDRASGVFQPLDPVIDRIHRRLKAEFDPHGIFNRGRMYEGF
jgi:glycolate oxidase FAD binding subunit